MLKMKIFVTGNERDLTKESNAIKNDEDTEVDHFIELVLVMVY